MVSEKKTENVFQNGGFYFIICIVFFMGGLYWVNDEFNKLNEKIYYCQSIQSTGTIDEDKVFEKRFENLENKYIDVLASKDTINFWLVILTVLLPASLGFFVYQKGKFEKKAEDELKAVEKLMKEAREKVENLDIITESKIKKIADKAKEEFDGLVSEAKKQKQDILTEAEKQRLVSGYFSDARKAENEKKYDIELEFYDEILKLDKHNLLALNGKGCALLILKKIEEAKQCFDKILEIDGKYSYAHYNIACYYALKSDVGNVILSLEKAEKEDYFKHRENVLDLINYNDKDLDNIKNTPEFQAFVEKVKKEYLD